MNDDDDDISSEEELLMQEEEETVVVNDDNNDDDDSFEEEVLFEEEVMEEIISSLSQLEQQQQRSSSSSQCSGVSSKRMVNTATTRGTGTSNMKDSSIVLPLSQLESTHPNPSQSNDNQRRSVKEQRGRRFWILNEHRRRWILRQRRQLQHLLHAHGTSSEYLLCHDR